LGVYIVFVVGGSYYALIWWLLLGLLVCGGLGIAGVNKACPLLDKITSSYLCFSRFDGVG